MPTTFAADRDVVNNRNKIQFHSTLAFGKIVEYVPYRITINASSTADITFAHDYPTAPQIIGWASVEGDDRWVPFTGLNTYTYSQLGFHLEIFPHSSDTEYGFYIENADTATRNVRIRAWLYFT